MNEDLNSVRVECDCGNIEHLMEFMYDDKQWDNLLYVTSELNGNVPFLTRLRYAFVYVFRLGPYNHCHFGESLIKPAAARDLLQFLQRYWDHIEGNNLFR